MSNPNRTLLFASAIFLAVPVLARSAEKDADLSKEYLTIVQTETRYLIRGLERLQETIIESATFQKDRTLYRRADEVLSLLTDFERSLKEGTSRAKLYTQFAELDARLHDLLDAVQKQGKDHRALQREANRVESVDEELHFALSAGDSSAERVQQVFKRQARRLLSAAKDLDETAQYALLKQADQASPGDFHKLVEAAARFEKSAVAGAGREQLRKDFQEVDRAWLRVIEVLKLIKPRENLYLLRMASQMDHIHERLYRLLGLKEKERPRLSIST